jgi:hypothetical protein
MKTYSIIAIVLILLAAGCRSPRESVSEINGKDSLSIEQEKSDTTEYELMIFDSGFDRWFRQTARPITFYEQSYLENWNSRLVNQWNTFRGAPWQMNCMPVSYIDYSPSIDYGKELNYRLFYYFRYVHERCRIFDSAPGEWR